VGDGGRDIRPELAGLSIIPRFLHLDFLHSTSTSFGCQFSGAQTKQELGFFSAKTINRQSKILVGCPVSLSHLLLKLKTASSGQLCYFGQFALPEPIEPGIMNMSPV
jgi:hypothetical protein